MESTNLNLIYVICDDINQPAIRLYIMSYPDYHPISHHIVPFHHKPIKYHISREVYKQMDKQWSDHCSEERKMRRARFTSNRAHIKPQNVSIYQLPCIPVKRKEPKKDTDLLEKIEAMLLGLCVADRP